MRAMIIVPPTIQAMMSGATMCSKSARRTTLRYADGSEETVKTGELEKLSIDWDNWFSVVSGIQSLRKREFPPETILGDSPLSADV